MAIDPRTKARVLAAWATGKWSEDQLATKYKVGKGTVGRWVRALKEDADDPETVQKGPGSSPKLTRFEESVMDFVVAGLKMVQAQAELLGSPDYLNKKTTDETVRHTDFIFERLERTIHLVRGVSGIGPSALPRISSEVVVPDVVEPDEAS